MNRAHDIERAAAIWLARRDEPGWSAVDETQLEAWLDASMAHKAAYWRLEHGWREADRICALGGYPAAGEAWMSRRRNRAMVAVAASVAAMIGIGTLAHRSSRPETLAAMRFQTQLGHHATVPLADGSKVELNTASAVRAAITNHHREVWLDRGEAYFEIAHREGHPFVVHAGSRTITVLGTKFSVRRDGDKVTVSVVEGRVRIDDARNPDTVPTAIITAGDVAVAQGPSTLLAANSEERVESDLAWRGGMLDFDRVPLADAAAEFNRYNRTKIEIGDAQAAAIRIGGTFQADNGEAFVRLLHDAYGLRIEPDGNIVKIYS